MITIKIRVESGSEEHHKLIGLLTNNEYIFQSTPYTVQPNSPVQDQHHELDLEEVKAAGFLDSGPGPGDMLSPKTKADIDFVKSVLPPYYNVKESEPSAYDSINCFSNRGIHKPGSDAEDDIYWAVIMHSFKSHFGERFIEVNHNTCTNHKNFTIHLKKI